METLLQERVMETLLQEEAGTAQPYIPVSLGSPPLLGDPLRPMTFGPRR